ncbi:hypothetical protein Taro_032366 [Colocasia esculenta]|uniref:Uncharacterized protein n=1 Tax=Colocasia esculenta TaxID=4460 RepID=A0A843VSH1_COLES|nr:hypothetical protein [Colocasia esculenta]
MSSFLLPVAITPSIASSTSKRLAVKTRKRAKEPSVFYRISSRASGRLALMKILQGNQTLPPDTFSAPVAISSGSSSSVGDVCSSSPSGIAAKDSPKGSFKERISALEGIEEDSASSADISSVAYHEPVALAAPKTAPEFSPEHHDSAPNLSPAVDVGSELALAIVLYVPPLATAQDTVTEPELPLDNAADISPEALAPQASSVPVDTVAVASSLAVSDTTLAETNVVPSATSTAIGIGLPSCSHEVDTSLWAAIDGQVNFQLRRADQEAVLESTQVSRECRRSALEKHDMNSQDLQTKIARLKAELGIAEDELARLELSRGQIEEVLLFDEGKAISAEEAIKEIVSEKARLKEMASSPYLGILPLEELFRDL